MTITSTDRRAGPFYGTGVLATYPFTFKVFEKADVAVTLKVLALEFEGLLDSDYTLTLNADQDTTPGGTVSYAIAGVVTALPAGDSLAISGAREYAQLTSLPIAGSYNAKIVEGAFDKLEIQIQQLRDAVLRSLQTSVLTPTGIDLVLPAPEANKIIAWNSAGDALTNRDVSDLSSVLAYANWRTDIFNGNGSSKAFALTVDPGNVSNTDVAIAGVAKTPGLDYTINGTTLTFAVAPAAGTNNVVVRYGQALPVGTATTDDVSYTTSGGTRTQTLKNKDLISVGDYLPAANGTTADNAKLAAAAAAAGRGYVYALQGTYGTDPYVMGRFTLQGAGHASTLASGSGTELRKVTNGLHLDMTGADACLRDLTLNGQRGSGKTGSGVRLKNERQRVDDVAVFDQAGNGFEIGDGSTTNCNIFQLLRPIAVNNGGHGVYVNSSSPDANAGTIIGCDIRSNLGDGIRAGGSIDVVGLGWHLASNTGRGLRLTSASQGWKVFGLYAEGNSFAPGDLVEVEVEAGSTQHILWGSRQGVTANWKDRNAPGKNSMLTYEPGSGRWMWRSEQSVWNPQDEASPYASVDFRAYLGVNQVNVFNLKGSISGTSGGTVTLQTKTDGGAVADRLVVEGATRAIFKNLGEGVLFNKNTADTTTPGVNIEGTGGRIDLVNSGAATMVAFYNTAGALQGSVTQNGTGTTTYGTASDGRLKQNLEPLGDQGAFFDEVKVYEGEFIAAPGERMPMFIAQELHALAPEAARVGGGDANADPWLVDDSKLVRRLVREMQSLRQRLAALEGGPKTRRSKA